MPFPPLILFLFLHLFAPNTAALSPPPPLSNPLSITWLTPTQEPGTTQGGRSTYAGGMPLGNGRTTLLAWANVSSGGVGMYIGHQDAMSSNTDLFKMGLLQLAVTPNPFALGPYFNQTLDMSIGCMLLHAGGTDFTTVLLTLRCCVNAHSDHITVTATARSSSFLFNISAEVSSTRPPGVWQYKDAFAACDTVYSQPDVAVDPIPLLLPLARPPPLSPSNKFRHATAHKRPQAWLTPLPPTASFQTGSLIFYHRNMDSDGLTVLRTLQQQGLGHLVASTPDYWRDLQFGFAVDSGAGVKLLRAGPRRLESADAAAEFEIRVTLLAVQTPTVDDWIADLAALVSCSMNVSQHVAWAEHEKFWREFWQRSYVSVGQGPPGSSSDQLNLMYIVTRYTQAVQSRGTQWPIKFNGMAFFAAKGSDGEADTRDWGASNWWQNTRLPYGSMLSAGREITSTRQ